MNNRYETIGLYDHNIVSYEKIIEGYKNQDIVGIVHATGTGKSYNALQLAYDNKDKKIIYVVPSNGIIEYVKEIINKNSNLDFDKDFSHVTFRTYQSFVNMSREELAQLEVDWIFIDEFQHLVGPVWGARIKQIINTHPNIKVFGMTAYTITGRGTIYERDMANPDTNEIFSNKIVSRYDICDAIIDGVLPKPIYKSAYIQLEDTAEKLEEILKKIDHNSKNYNECKKILNDIRKRIHEAPSISELIQNNIKPNGKYIYFCPFVYENSVNDMDTIMEECKKWFLQMGLKDEDIIFYKTTSDMGTRGKKNRIAFYNDVDLEGKTTDGKLRVMFAINQYNEGVHAPNVDGVIMGRGTSSDIVFFEQLGRALSVRGETGKKIEELEKYSKKDLLDICNKREIKVDENVSKEEIIEKILAPVVIDLSNNFEFIKQLENNLKDKIREIQKKGPGNKRNVKINEYSFDIEILNQNIFETLKYVMDRLTMTWDDKFELAKVYYEHYGNLLIPRNFKTINGYEYDENGLSLGSWINTQRQQYDKLSEEKKSKLKSIGFVEELIEEKWNKNFELAKVYYEYHGNLFISARFKTINGYEYDEDGLSLGIWIRNQRQQYDKLSEEKKSKLKSIGFVEALIEEKWNKNFELAKVYYEHYGNLLIPRNFKTINGYEYDENGSSLGNWIDRQRLQYDKLSDEKKSKLKSIGFVEDLIEEKWSKNFELAKIYYDHHNNLLIPFRFKTINGYEHDEDGLPLGNWISSQRKQYDKLSEEKKVKLKSIGFVVDVFEEQWNKNFGLAKVYYEHYDNLLIPFRFKTINGYEYDEDGSSLGNWINTQRLQYDKLSEERKIKLNSIGFVENVTKYKTEIKEICIKYDISYELNNKILSKISIQEFVAKINFLMESNVSFIKKDGKLHNIFSMSSVDIQKMYGVSLIELIEKHYKSGNKRGV